MLGQHLCSTQMNQLVLCPLPQAGEEGFGAADMGAQSLRKANAAPVGFHSRGRVGKESSAFRAPGIPVQAILRV